MHRGVQSFAALLTAFSVACSGRGCGSSGSVSTDARNSGAAGAVDLLTGQQQSDASERVEALLADFAGVLSGARPGEQVTPDQARARLQKLYGLLEATSRALPRDTFDFSAVTNQVGREPAKLRDWVSTHTTLVPYRGVLRDATGTLMDRVGNSLDRALLLGRLIQEGGGQIRLARARLTTDQAAALLEKPHRVAGSGIPLPAASADLSDAELSSFASQAGVTPDVARSHAERIAGAASRTRNDVHARVKTQASAIAQAIGPANEAAGPRDSRAALAESLQDHWWVQWRDGITWVDLDPTADGPAQVLAQVQETTDPAELAAELHHQVEIRVVVERWDGSRLTEASPVSLTARPSEVAGSAVELRQVPMAWPATLMGSAPDAVQQFRAVVLAQREWLPTLTVGSRRVSRASITDTGEVNDRSMRNPVALSAPSGLFDALGGGGDDPPPPGVLTAEWLDYVIRVPGAPVRTIRREIFDLLGPAARAARRAPAPLTDEVRLARGLSLIGEIDILLVASRPSGAFIAHQAAVRLQAARPALETLIAVDTGVSRQFLVDRVSKVQRLPGRLHDLASARLDWGPGRLVYTAQPNIFSRHLLPITGLDGRPRIVEAIDIVASEVDVHPGGAVDARSGRIEQGVLDANLETALLGPGATGTSTADALGTGDFADRWVLVRSPQELSGVDLSPDMATRIEAEIQAGYIALLPRAGRQSPASAFTGWWRIDPQSGNVLALGDRGWGQADVEYAHMVMFGAMGGLLCLAILPGHQWDYVLCAAVGVGGAATGVGVVAAFAGAKGIALVATAVAILSGGVAAGAGAAPRQ